MQKRGIFTEGFKEMRERGRDGEREWERSLACAMWGLWAVIGVFVASATVLSLSRSSAAKGSVGDEAKATILKRRYLAGFITFKFADWAQGPFFSAVRWSS